MRENQAMPLPNAPTRRPSTPASRQSDSKVHNEVLFKAVLLVLIGLGVLLSPYFITSPGMQGIVAKAAAVGWFALVLGGGFMTVYLRRRFGAPSKP